MKGSVWRYTGGETDLVKIWEALGLSAQDAYWFGWSVETIHLPQPLPSSLPAGEWEHLRIFCKEAELRLYPSSPAREILLLTESLTPGSSSWACILTNLEVRSGVHPLLGKPSALFGGNLLGEIAFPRVFDYSLPQPIPKGSRLCACVRHYYDKVGRRLYTRYAGLQALDQNKITSEVNG